MPSITLSNGGGAGKEDTSFQPMRGEMQEGFFFSPPASFFVSCSFWMHFFLFSPVSHLPDILLVDGIVTSL